MGNTQKKKSLNVNWVGGFNIHIMIIRPIIVTKNQKATLSEVAFYSIMTYDKI